MIEPAFPSFLERAQDAANGDAHMADAHMADAPDAEGDDEPPGTPMPVKPPFYDGLPPSMERAWKRYCPESPDFYEWIDERYAHALAYLGVDEQFGAAFDLEEHVYPKHLRRYWSPTRRCPHPPDCCCGRPNCPAPL